jgi:membrane fusion protein, multidrug efflux system
MRRILLACGLVLCLAAAGCGRSSGVVSAAGPPPAPLVSVVEVQPEDAALYSEYTAETYARDMVEVRGRVDGYIEQRLFQTGADVKAGQVLYTLDRRPYEADVAKAKGDVEQSQANHQFAQHQVALLQAEADLKQAQANMLKAQQDVNRLGPLVKEEAAAQQDLDNALAALQANQANVNSREANVEQMRLSTQAQIDTTAAQVDSTKAQLATAQLNLDYATIRAPIGGRIGESMIQPGGLVTKTSTMPLTTIVPLDPIWVRFKVSESEYLTMQRTADEARVLQRPIEMVLADGRVHPYPGRFQNTVNQVDAKTGTLELQATFPNPQHNILPGQFGRVRLKTSEKKNVLLVPQKALLDLQGSQSVYAIDANNKVLARPVVLGERLDTRVIVQQGLKAGDRVIVEGVQKVRPGVTVNAEPYRPAARASVVAAGK